MTRTSTQRVNKTRQAKRDRGLVKVEVWVSPEHKNAVKALEKELNKDNQA